MAFYAGRFEEVRRRLRRRTPGPRTSGENVKQLKEESTELGVYAVLLYISKDRLTDSKNNGEARATSSKAHKPSMTTITTRLLPHIEPLSRESRASESRKKGFRWSYARKQA